MANYNVPLPSFAMTIHKMVEETNEENKKALAMNLSEAARAARDDLMAAKHNSGGVSPRYIGSLSGWTNPYGTYDSGWFVYGRGWNYETISRVVANRHAPTLTHLLEFGHAGAGHFIGEEGKMHRAYKYVRGDKAIASAYERAAGIAKEGT